MHSIILVGRRSKTIVLVFLKWHQMTVYLVYLRNISIIIIITEYIFVASLVSYFHDCFTAGLFD